MTGNEIVNLAIERIKPLAWEFRLGLERCDESLFPDSMAEFPLGACGDAIHLLGTYFIDVGLGASDYVCGTRIDPERPRSPYSHAWLEHEGIIVDITADQFIDVEDPVIVIEQSAWHDAFEEDQRRDANYRLIREPHIRNPLDKLYWAVVYEISPTHELLKERKQLKFPKFRPIPDPQPPATPTEFTGVYEYDPDDPDWKSKVPPGAAVCLPKERPDPATNITPLKKKSDE